MDDDIYGQRPKTPLEEAWHKRQNQKTYDIIRIKNPTNKDFYIRYDTNQYQRVPANATLDVPRFKAEWYIKHMKDQMINEMSQQKHDDEMKERQMKGYPAYKSKWEENQETYVSAAYPKTDDSKLMTEIISDLWIGLVLENKTDQAPEAPQPTQLNLEAKESKILESFQNRRVTDEVRTVISPEPPIVAATPPVMPTPSPFAAMNEKLDASEVTSE